jgi:hypothetical protein
MCNRARYVASALALGVLWYVGLSVHPDLRVLIRGALGVAAGVGPARHLVPALCVMAATVSTCALLARDSAGSRSRDVWGLGALLAVVGCVLFAWIALAARWISAGPPVGIVPGAVQALLYTIGAPWVAGALAWWLVLPLGWLSAMALRRITRCAQCEPSDGTARTAP